MNPEERDQLNQYLEDLRREPDPKLLEIAREARNQGVPIMQPETMSAVEQLIRLHHPKRILEIGTAVGYSALNMVIASNKESHVWTLERDHLMIEQAQRNIKALGLEETITILEKDARDRASDVQAYGPFDLIFIDAGKGHYLSFFNDYLPFLSDNGMILCDNVLLRGFVTSPDKAPKRFQKMAEKMRAFNQWLLELSEFHTIILPIGDGLSISIRK